MEVIYIRDRNILNSLPSSLQKKLKNFYNILCETVPPSILMSKGYFKVIELMQDPEVLDEKSGFIENTQRELLTQVLKNALLNVPYYRDNVPINPEDVEPANALEILNRFPLLGKDEILKYHDDFISDRVNKKTLYYTTTGGTTGIGLGVWRTLEELQIEKAFIDHMWNRHGYNQKMKVLRMGLNSLVPLNRPPFQVIGKRLLVSPLHLGDKWFPKIVEKINDFGPDFIHAYPSCVEFLALYLKSQNISVKIKAIFLASEEVKPEQIDLFKVVFGAPICFHYGATEQVLLGHGCYVNNKIGYHLNPLYGIAENYQDENGNYEMVGTSLWNNAMPFIRYRTTDYGKINNVENLCIKCENKWKTVFQLEGRKQNYLVTKQGILYSESLVPLSNFIWDYVKICQYVQNIPGELELRVVPNERYSEEAEQKLISWQKEELCEFFDLKLLKVDDIPLTTSGKRRLVVVNHKFNQSA